MSVDLAEVLRDYQAMRPNLERLGEIVSTTLRQLAVDAGMRVRVESRCKDERSLLRKCATFGGGLDKTPDLVGAKVISRFTEDIELMRPLIESTFDASEPDEKVNTYDPDRFGYLGVHYQVKLKEPDCPLDLIGVECEIILHTEAEAAWDSITHELLWKPFVELPKPSKRALNRLMALVELFDKEVTTVRHEYTSSPDYRTAYILDILDKYFVRLDPVEYDREMSVKTIDALAPIIDDDRLKRLDIEIQQFVADRHKDLVATFQQFPEKNDLRGIFLHQPESLLIFALIDWNEKFKVKSAWENIYPLKYLRDLGYLWMTTFPD